MATSVPRLPTASKSGTLSTLMQQTQPNQVSPTYTGRGVIPTVAGSNLPVTDMNQLQLTPEGAAQRTQDLGAWNNQYMNSPVYNPGGSNTYSIQNGGQDSLLASFYGSKAGGNSNVRTNAPREPNPGFGDGLTNTTPTPNPAASTGALRTTRENQLSESGGPQYSMQQITEGLRNGISGMNNGYLGRVSGERTGTTSATGNPYSAQYPWSNWKLWKQ